MSRVTRQMMPRSLSGMGMVRMIIGRVKSRTAIRMMIGMMIGMIIGVMIGVMIGMMATIGVM